MRDTLEQSVRLLEQTKGAELELVRSAKASDIVVVEGEHDNIEKILDALEVPYTMVGHIGDATRKNPNTVFVNCKEYGSFSEDAVRRYVKDGGRIVTTDWALNVFTKSFPGYVKKGKEDIPNNRLGISAANYLGVRLMGTKFVSKKPKWFFEESSYIVFNEKKEGKEVISLLVSQELQGKYHTNLVAFGIKYSKGEAIHFTSHLDAQEAGSKSEGIATDYSTAHAVLMLCTKMPILWDPSNPNADLTKSIMLRPNIGGEKSKALI